MFVVDEELLGESILLRLDMHSVKWWAWVVLHGVRWIFDIEMTVTCGRCMEIGRKWGTWAWACHGQVMGVAQERRNGARWKGLMNMFVAWLLSTMDTVHEPIQWLASITHVQ